MTPQLDLHPAAREMTRITSEITDDQLGLPTPCEGITVAGLLDHVLGLAQAFRDAAMKRTGPDDPQGGIHSEPDLSPTWRDQLPVRLDELATAWEDPAAWEGETWAGGVQAPAPQMAGIAVDELVLHGWDLARATGQDVHVDPPSLAACLQFTSAVAEAGPDARQGLFGPALDVPEDATDLDRALRLSGRDPAWSPA